MKKSLIKTVPITKVKYNWNDVLISEIHHCSLNLKGS